MTRWLAACVLAAVCFAEGGGGGGQALAAGASCAGDLSLSLDYARALVAYHASGLSAECLDGLAARGLPDDGRWPAATGGTWSVNGQVPKAHLAALADGHWTVQLDLDLQPEDVLRISLPFTVIDLGHLDPPPANLQALTVPSALALDGRSASDTLEYRGSAVPGRVIIPFTPVQKTTSLTLTPVYGRMLHGDTDALRVSGTVGFTIANGTAELIRHCQTPPGFSADSYRAADLLSMLDTPAHSGFALLPSVYLSRPSYLAVATTIVSCEATAGQGLVQAAFNGRVRHVPQLAQAFPAGALPADSHECNRPIGPRPPAPVAEPGCPTGSAAWPRAAYEITLGEIVLGPGDRLDIQLPGVDVLGVRPVPDHVGLGPAATPDLSYVGPARFGLTLEYSPGAALIAQQTPSTLRASVASIDAALNGVLATVVAPACGVPVSVPLASVLFVAIATIVLTRRTGQDSLTWLAWGLLAVALGLAWRGTFGLLAAGILWWASTAEHVSLRRVVVALLALAAIGVGQHIDCLSTQLFPMSPADAPTTPLTPLVLLPLGSFLVLVLISPRWQATPRPTIFALAVVLMSVAAFDVVQQSLLVDALLGLGFAWLAIGIRRAPAETSLAALAERVRVCLRGGVVPIGMLLLTVFTFERSLTTTTAFAETFVQWSQGFESALLLVSIVASFLALAALFLVVYPLLPFGVGYLKALAFGAYLVALFLGGVGADERLIITLPDLLIGRAVYYLSVPVLIGIYLDLKQHAGPAPDAKPYLERLRTQINIAGAIASILAPAIYASVAKSPVVTSYFDLLNQLARTT